MKILRLGYFPHAWIEAKQHTKILQTVTLFKIIVKTSFCPITPPFFDGARGGGAYHFHPRRRHPDLSFQRADAT